MVTYSKFTYISLFSGAGFLDAAIRIAVPESRCILYVERELAACEILAARMADGSLDEAPIFTDISALNGIQYRGAVGGVVGGPPCTDLSVAGKQAGIHGDASGLFFEYMRIVREVQPEWCFVENVPPILSFPNGGIVLGEFAALGFDAEWGTLRASDVGAPHRRDRAFILAYARRERNERRRIDGELVRKKGTAEGDGEQWQWGRYSAGDSESELAYSPQRGLGVRWEPSGGGGLTDGSDEALAHSTGVRFEQLPKKYRGDALRQKQEGSRRQWRTEQELEGSSSRECIPLFPPGPSDAEAWRIILASRPDLAPAIESGVCGLDDGPARVDRLRAAGNGVVVLQAALAFRILAERAGLIL